MSFLNAGDGASAVPAAPSNPNARYNCTLSHAELVLLVGKSKEAEAEKKKKDMLELISAAQKLGALPSNAASNAAATESKPAAGAADKPSDKDKPDETRSESKSARQRAKFAEKVKDECAIDTRDWELKYLRLKNQTDIAEARAKLEAGYASSRGYHSDDDEVKAPRTRGSRRISKAEVDKMVMNTPERKKAEAMIAERERDLAKLKKSVADRIAPSPKKSVVTQVSTNTNATESVVPTDTDKFQALLQSQLGFSVDELKLLVENNKKKPGKSKTKEKKDKLSDSEDSDSEVSVDGDDILSSARKRKPEPLALPPPKSETKSKRSKKKPIIIAFDGPLVVLKGVLEKCKIPTRKVKIGKAFESQFSEIGERLAARLLKVDGIKMQLEGLLRDTFSYPIGERDIRTIAMEILWIAENSKVRIPRAVFS